MDRIELTEQAIELFKNLIETQSFSSEEEETAMLIENWFKAHDITFKRNKNIV